VARVLIVDDREDDRYLMREVLLGQGHVVEEAVNGIAALAAARRNPPSLVVSDVLMPVMDGFALCREWHNDDGLRDIPFIFYTATYTGSADEDFALSIGADRFIIKPQEPEILAAEIQSVLLAGCRPARRGCTLPDEAFHAAYAVTVARKLEAKVAELECANRQLTEINRELERFAYIASHDLQEPLRTIISFTQLLQRRYQQLADPEAVEFSHLVVDAAERMHHLINDLLTYSKVSAALDDMGPVDMRGACAIAVQNLEAAIQEEGGRIIVGYLPTVWGVESQIVQVLQNLISNALKFHRRGVPPVVTIAAEDQAQGYLLSVTDNGIGIEQSSQDIFEIFRRLHTSRDYPGTGVGLAICHRIVQRHGGRIWHEPAPQSGSIIKFTLTSHPVVAL
jgi:signal transduction histidine kinase